MDDSWEGAQSTLRDDEERRVLFAALDSFRQYRRAAHYNITHQRRQNFYALPEDQWKMLAAPPFNVLAHLDKVDDAIDANADIATAILRSGLEAFGVPREPERSELEWRGCATPSDMEKAKSTIRQFYRDWSEEGAGEREAFYSPVLNDLQQLFEKHSRGGTKVLIPGAGLGRLVFEVCKLGFAAEGNEISFHQLMASNWVLNQLSPSDQFNLHPFALGFSNHLSKENQLRGVRIPDIHPGTELAAASEGTSPHAFERMSMTAADFVVLYSDEEHRAAFDAVVTMFFIDTAPNFVRYLETIHRTLRPGGYWVNLGPLLWHFEQGSPNPSMPEGTESNGQGHSHEQDLGIGEQGSVELALEDVLLLIDRMGFRVMRQEVLQTQMGYIHDPTSMAQHHYACSHFVAQRTI